jgi:hypothetical protein
MTLARRLLIAGGAGSFTPPPPITPVPLYTTGSVVDPACSNYSGFPGLCVMPNGNLLLVWREGTSHVSADGVIKQAISTDGGLTWGGATTAYSPGGSVDARDPSVMTTASGNIVLSFFLEPAETVHIIISTDNAVTWGSPITLSSGYSNTACSAPMVEVSPSLFLQPIYGLSGGHWESAVMASTDGGSTWGAPVLMANGGSIDWTEPWITRLHDDRLMCLIRDTTNVRCWQLYSSDNGATWPTSSNLFPSDSRHATLETQHHALLIVYRDAAGQGVFRGSWDLGATWTMPSATNLPSPSSNFMYAAAAQFPAGKIVGAWSQEVSSSVATLHVVEFKDQ